MSWCVSDYCCGCNSRRCTCEADEARANAAAAKDDIAAVEELAGNITVEMSGTDDKAFRAAVDQIIAILNRYTGE